MPGLPSLPRAAYESANAHRLGRCAPHNMEEKHVNKNLMGTFVALALTGATVTGAAVVGAPIAHAADVGVSLNVGDVAIGYSDGYWDHGHQWHKWQSADHRQAYQRTNGAEYHAGRHTKAPNHGWHEQADHH
jgi:hypothetical protein